MDWSTLSPKNIIIRMPNWLGDLVMATPVIKDVKEHWPHAKVTAMCEAKISQLIAKDPHADEIYSYKKPNGWIHGTHPWEIIDTLRKGQYDLGILLTNSFSSALWFWKGNVKNRLGYGDHYRSLLLNKALPYPKEKETQHLVKTYKMLLSPLGIPLSDTDPYLEVSAEEILEAQQLLHTLNVKAGQKLIGLNPGAAYGSAKCWPPEKFKELSLKLLQNPQNTLLYFGDPKGAPLVQDICQGMPERVINLAGRTTIRQLMALLKLCSILLTNDSGPMHIASALKTPLIALFGSTSDVKTGPYNGGKVIHKHVACSPCYKRTCPIDFRCMTSISVEEVFSEIQKVMDREPDVKLS